MFQLDGFFKCHRFFDWNQRARSCSPRQRCNRKPSWPKRSLNAISGSAARACRLRIPQRPRVSRSSIAFCFSSFSGRPANKTSIDKKPSCSASFPGGITVTPEKPRAASTAASGLEAAAIFAESPRSAARAAIFWGISVDAPKSGSIPARSRIAVSAAASSTQGEKDCAQSRRTAWAVDSCSVERGRKANSEHSSACAFVMPGAMPNCLAPSFTAKTFSNGGLPSKIATGCDRKAGSARRTAATWKFGMKMQANMTALSHRVIRLLSH